MSAKYHLQPKTPGPRAAQLVTELNELRRSTFTVTDVKSITGLAAAARNLVHKAQQRGLVTRLKPGLYNPRALRARSGHRAYRQPVPDRASTRR
ncbi:MAG: type IV toxin-antitoxin system AbiEi family antitoxin domain-containing protein [Acidobacteriaceae bacterium]